MIYLIDGLPGAGKSYWLNYILYKRYMSGQKIYPNWPVLYGDGTVESWHEFEEVLSTCGGESGAVIAVDEAYKVFDAHRWMSLPLSFAEKLAEHRHDALDLMTATQNFGDLDLRVRNKVGVWYHCKSIFRFPFRQNIKPWLQLIIVEERHRYAVGEKSQWKLISSTKLWMSRLWTKTLYNSYENLKQSKYICQLRIDSKKKLKRMTIASREAISRGLVRG